MGISTLFGLRASSLGFIGEGITAEGLLRALRSGCGVFRIYLGFKL